MRKYVIAIDLGGTNIKIAVVKDGRKIVNKIILPTDLYKNKGALINGLSQLSLEIIKYSKIKKRDILGIGIGTPGLIDSRRGIIHRLVNIKGFKDVPLKRLMEKKTGIQTFLDNDVNIMTLGELHYGAGRGAKNMVCITLGTGVGGGIVIDGRLYRGSCLSAGEIGHMPLNEHGPRCNCGGFGCMEKFVGNKYIIGAAVTKIKKGKKSIIKKMVGGDLRKITPEIISRAAGNRDRLAVSIWEDVGSHLGVTLAGVINLLNPEKIVIGGGVSGAGRLLFETIRKTVKERAMKMPAKYAKIVKAKLGPDAGLIGAAVLVRLGKNDAN
ncbi:MAG: ROK family protein [Candidatus Omnitrophica bacterium]|nr:ROK family protein [Candidatus Omnitrophota bacterium]